MARAAVIDADGHILERQSDIRKYLEPPWDRRDTPLWQAGYPWDFSLFNSLGFPEYPGGLSPQEQLDIWLRVMDRERIETTVLFPTNSGLVAQIREPAFAVAVSRAVNTHFAKEYGGRSKRLRPVGVLPLQDPHAAAQELRRAASELGLVSFALLSAGLPLGLGDPFYDPLYAEAERLNVPLCIHASGSRFEEIGGDRFKTFTEVHCFSFPASTILHFTSVLFNAVPLRFPKLRLAFLEIGATWLPYYLDRMDEHWEKRGAVETSRLTKKPSALFRESPIYVSVEAEESFLGQAVEHVGDDHFVFASDFPHWDASFPKNLRALEERKDLSQETKRKVLYHNARALFGL